jgi:tyrosyl-tRNA synthetase
MLSPEKQFEELKRGTDEILSEKDLLEKLKKSYQKKKLSL